jgi:hypothetical protein
MPEVLGVEKIFSVRAKKRFSRFRLFGTAQMGHSYFGDEDIYFFRDEFGIAAFGTSLFADVILLSGIYRTDNVTGRTKHYREPFYITKNPRTENQQIQRNKFADAVAGWQVLTDEQKLFYNNKAKGKHLSGYNLYLKEYLLSN